MAKHKSEKIHDVVHDNDRKLNLHEIKAQTGAGSGHKHDAPTQTINAKSVNNTYSNNSKSDKIHEAVSSTEGKINLHTIKAQTGAGNGYSNSNTSPSSNPIKDVFVGNKKFDKIAQVVTKLEGKANLHKIKAQTGAGDGYVTEEDLNDEVNTPKCDFCSTCGTNSGNHKSHKIHAVFHAYDRKLNLHEIKARTGAGSGYKH